MDTPDIQFGWMFAAIAAIFAVGLIPRWAVRFYPTSPPFLVRLAAPAIFGVLAEACFMGLAVKALSAVIICGMVLILFRRWVGRKSRSAG